MSSGVRAVVVMDPIETINPAKDTTLGILLAAQASGWEIFYAELGDLWLRDGVAWGRLAPLQVFDDPRTWFIRGARRYCQTRRLRRHLDAQGSALRHRVHLQHIHSRSGSPCGARWSATTRRAFGT